MSSKKYCSLDIETSGFDPAKDEILEIGFVFFSIEAELNAAEVNAEKKTLVKITEEYTKVFKPESEVSETILALTGITKEELEAADSFAKYKEEIQEQLKDACVVGHNIGFDIKFLQGLGIKFSGPTIDTLDLAQVFLPTHPSYNLENLMHYFGVPHIEAHRALADAKATLQVLEGMLKIFAGFPEGLKQEIQRLIKPYNLPWERFLNSGFTPLEVGRPKASAVLTGSQDRLLTGLKANTLYNFPLGTDVIRTSARSLKKAKTKSIIVVPKQKQAMKLWQEGLAEGVFLPGQIFNEEKFSAFKLKSSLTLQELSFILKITVWQKTNWQNESASDLNLTFFGGQFKNAAFGKDSAEKTFAHLVCDYLTFTRFAEGGKYKKRKVVFAGLAEMETAVSENIADKANWGYINYLLKSFYDPETATGSVKLKPQVEEGMAASDLFFGLVSAMFQTDPPSFSQISFKDLEADFFHFNQIKTAAENYTAKLETLNKVFDSEEIARFNKKLLNFFEPLENRVKWIELSNRSCAFYSSPVDITGLVKKLLAYGKEAVLCDCLPKYNVIEYFDQRLGLGDLKKENIGLAQLEGNPDAAVGAGKDLFFFLSSSKPRLSVENYDKEATEQELLAITQKSNMPAAILFGSTLSAKTFYYKNYKALENKGFFVLAQTGSGGTRILRNFAIHKQSLLLAADKLVLKFIASENGSEPFKVKTLVLGRVPFEQYKHPYLEAVASQFKKPFDEFSIPRALLNIHQIIRFFYSDSLKKVVVWDSKLKKDYAKPFLRYLEGLPRINSHKSSLSEN